MTHDEAAMIEFILTRGCRRLIISAFMDGQNNKVNCNDLDGAVLCDNCHGRHEDMLDAGFENEYLNWESSSVAAPTPRQISGSHKRACTEDG
jgi:hypothetical protein